MEKKKKMEVDHYTILGLPSGLQGIKLSQKQITKAYKSKARLLHPDKRPNDPNANAEFQELQSSYETLKDPRTRKAYDASIITRLYYNEEDSLSFDDIGFVLVDNYRSLLVIGLSLTLSVPAVMAFLGVFSSYVGLSVVAGIIVYDHYYADDRKPYCSASESREQVEEDEDIDGWVLV